MVEEFGEARAAAKVYTGDFPHGNVPGAARFLKRWQTAAMNLCATVIVVTEDYGDAKAAAKVCTDTFSCGVVPGAGRFCDSRAFLFCGREFN